MGDEGTADRDAKMPSVLRRRRDTRKAMKLARLLAALDSAAGERSAPRRASRLSFGRT